MVGSAACVGQLSFGDVESLFDSIGCRCHWLWRVIIRLRHPPAVKTTLAPLPETVTSFGAATSGDYLYAFGGHKGERHDYSVEKVSGSFQRLKLSDGRAWESLPSATPGQGQPLVAHGGLIYRIGGMAARNHEDAKQDLYSMTVVQRFDPKTAQWENLPPLPAVRSSHDAVVVGEKLYVAGGWQLAGGTNKPAWPANALVLDLAHPAVRLEGISPTVPTSRACLGRAWHEDILHRRHGQQQQTHPRCGDLRHRFRPMGKRPGPAARRI
ncbi:MAG: hypothetical protein WDM76_03995 [Limisphaerales bacterium]